MQIREIQNPKNPKRGVLFESGRWDDFLTTAKLPDKGWAYEGREFGKGSRTVSEDFSGTKSFEEAVDLAENGWPEGRAEFADISAKSVQQIESILPTIGYDVAGMYPSVPRFLAGDQESMVTHNPELNSRRHIVPIYVSISASANNKRSTIKNRGAAIAGLIDYLETSGHSVQLIVFEHSTSGGILYWGEYELKAAGEPLDLDMMAFAITHPSCLRRLHFAVMEQNGFRFKGNFARCFHGTYGTPGNGWPEKVKSELADGPTLMFDGLRGNYNSAFCNIEQATKTVLAEWEKAQEEINWDVL
tara:strand:+ start:2942 stop:3847 length:906 start_codon:yes stop_codon:yes gene_type:complete